MITIRNILWINGKPVCCRKLWICNINWTNWEEEQFLFWSKSQKFLYHFSDLQLQWKQAFLELLCVEDNSNMGRCITLFKWLLDLVIKMSIIPYFMHTHTHTHTYINKIILPKSVPSPHLKRVGQGAHLVKKSQLIWLTLPGGGPLPRVWVKATIGGSKESGEWWKKLLWNWKKNKQRKIN